MKSLQWYRANARVLEITNGRSADTGRPWLPVLQSARVPVTKSRAAQNRETSDAAQAIDYFLAAAEHAGLLHVTEPRGRKYRY